MNDALRVVMFLVRVTFKDSKTVANLNAAKAEENA